MATDSVSVPTSTSAVVPTLRKGHVGLKLSRFLGKTLAILMLTAGSILVLLPLIWMLSTSLKARENATEFPPTWIPQESVKIPYNGRNYFVYDVPYNGETLRWGMLKKQPGGMAIFFNPENPEEQITAKLADASKVMKTVIHWENYKIGLTMVPFARYVWNTLLIVITTTIGVITSCTLVAYGFSRFRAPYINILFLILLSTIMLPSQVTLIPTFVLFQKIGWYDTFWPLIVPAFFANAWDVFLLRQFFRTIPEEMCDAARVDGASEWQIFTRIVLPLSTPVLATVTVFTFLYAWNDFTGPLLFLTSPRNFTMALGLQDFQGQHTMLWNQMMAAAMIFTVPIIIAFFFAQKTFIQGIKLTGSKE
jgi:multiple sugar transport system permease protein